MVVSVSGGVADETDQPHLIAALDGVVRRLGGVTRAWRFDRIGTVVAIGSDRVLPSFAEEAKHTRWQHWLGHPSAGTASA